MAAYTAPRKGPLYSGPARFLGLLFFQSEIRGECPEWQRGGTVNPLLYGFVGSSPTSPTISQKMV